MDQTVLNIRERAGRRKQKSLEQHEWEPQRKDHRHDNHAHEAHRAEGVTLNVGDTPGSLRPQGRPTLHSVSGRTSESTHRRQVHPNLQGQGITREHVTPEGSNVDMWVEGAAVISDSSDGLSRSDRVTLGNEHLSHMYVRHLHRCGIVLQAPSE